MYVNKSNVANFQKISTMNDYNKKSEIFKEIQTHLVSEANRFKFN